MLDLGRSFLACVERSPRAVALVEGELRLSYADWAPIVAALAQGLGRLGLNHGDRLATVLQNRWQAATLHWACQMAGVVMTPLNWRFAAEEIDYCLKDSEARAIAFEPASTVAVADAPSAGRIPRLSVAGAASADATFEEIACASGAALIPAACADHVSLMLYTSGTTGRPKGVPRRHRAERAAALAHVAQNRYGPGEVTLGVMPLYHTMGVRSLLAMALIDGTFVCQPRFDAGVALELIAREKITNLYLVPTLYHDIVNHPSFAQARVASVRKLGFAGMSMTDGLLRKVSEAFRPDLFVNHYGSSEIYTFTIAADATARPGSAGKAGINQRVRVVRLGTGDPTAIAAAHEEGEIIAELSSDEAFEGYWRRPDADAKALRDGWYFTGDTGYFDAEGELFVTGRVDDMIISGGENIFPVEIESVLSLHPAVAEVAVVGLPDERWGARVAAFVKRARPVAADELDAHCRASALAAFKRPREYVFVTEVPKSPVGKLLRRLLIAGQYEREG